MTRGTERVQTADMTAFPQSCRAPFSGFPHPAQLFLESGAYTPGSVQPMRHLADVLGTDTQFPGDPAENPIKPRCLGQLRRDRFKMGGQVEPLDYSRRVRPESFSVKKQMKSAAEIEKLSPCARKLWALMDQLKFDRQQDLAAALGTRQGTVTKWLNDEARPSIKALLAMANLASGEDRTFFLKEAGIESGIAEAAQDGRIALQLHKTEIIGQRERPSFASSWDPDLLVFVVETFNEKLRRRKLRLPDSKYARAIALCYERCQYLGRRDEEIVEGVLKMVA